MKEKEMRILPPSAHTEKDRIIKSYKTVNGKIKQKKIKRLLIKNIKKAFKTHKLVRYEEVQPYETLQPSMECYAGECPTGEKIITFTLVPK